MDERMKRKTMRDYARGVILVDFLVLLATTLIVYLENYRSFQIVDNIYDEGLLRITASPQLVGAGLLVTWLILLSVFKSRDPKIVGSDFSEYRRVLNATLSVLGLLAFVSLYFKVDVSRLYVTEVLVIGLVALLLSRRLGRNWLSKQRKQGNFTRRVAIYGPTSELALELQKYASHKESEFEPIMTIEDNNLLVLKYLNSDKTKTVDLEQLPEVLAEENIEILQVVGSGPSSAQMHKKLYWALDGWDISFVVSPAITGVSSSKLTTRVIAGSPLIKISSTKFSGPQYFVKTTFDIVFSLIALIVAFPVMLATAIAIKLTDRGPIFFKQTRIGLNGKEFQILKFRSMKVGAEKEFDELASKAGYEVNAVQFKLKDDPRVTSIGKLIRKTSVDELPQFINVLKGDMSVVGPRPHVHKEVEAYDDYALRRLLVKPGITGPWQIGGRSELTWDESVAFDVGYVENWNLLSDVAIIVKTIRYLAGTRKAF
jgi:exopolysaccharide biosynthesis polyprenyl glycosylphosphotransferase